MSGRLSSCWLIVVDSLFMQAETARICPPEEAKSAASQQQQHVQSHSSHPAAPGLTWNKAPHLPAAACLRCTTTLSTSVPPLLPRLRQPIHTRSLFFSHFMSQHT